MRRVRGGTWWALAAALVAALAAPVVWAGPAAAETTLQVDAGYAGAFVPGQAVPVRVAVSADRLVRASLEVTVGGPGRSVPVAMAVEVPGGSQKQFLLVAGTAFEQVPQVKARLHQDGKVLASAETQVRASGDQELVGLLPGVLRGRSVPGPAALAVDAGTARFAAIGEAELEGAPQTLGPLSTLAMDADELARLAPGARTGVLSWVDGGGRLLVDAERGRTVPGLPDDWQPGARGRASAGLGEVVTTDGAMAAGRWANLVEPTARSSSAGRGAPDTSVASSLASEAGLRAPRLGWLVGFLAVYVVAVGPLLFLAVRRGRRPELAWVAVPLVALLFSTGSYVVGRNLRTATQLVHGTVLTDGPAGPTATSYLGVFSRGGETARIGFDAGWSTLPATDGFAAALSGVSVTADGPEARIPLDAGQFGMVAGTGPVPGAGALEVSALTNAGGRVTGTVRNPSAFTLEEVAVFVGTDGTVVGTMAPGDERDWTIQNPRAPNRAGVEFRLWSSMANGGPGAALDMGLWQAAMQSTGSSLRSGGSVVAAGWTREHVPSVRMGGRTARPEGRTLLLAQGPVRLGAAADPIESAVRQDVVRDPFSDRFNAVDRGSGSVVRFVLPAGAPAANLVLRHPFGGAELWQDGAWRAAACAGPDCGSSSNGNGSSSGTGSSSGIASPCPPGVPCRAEGPPTTVQIFRDSAGPGAGVAVPEAAVRDGVVYARLPGPASADSGVQITLGRAT